jgi:hypothetical protein
MPLKGIWPYHCASIVSLCQHVQACTHPFASLCTKRDANALLHPPNAHFSVGTNSHTLRKKMLLFYYRYFICFSNVSTRERRNLKTHGFLLTPRYQRNIYGGILGTCYTSLSNCEHISPHTIHRHDKFQIITTANKIIWKKVILRQCKTNICI